MNASWYTLTEDDLGRVRAETDVAQVESHFELPSTNDRALELAQGSSPALPCLLTAARQTAGRGRKGNRWWSMPGSLTFSLICDLTRWRLSPTDLPQLSLLTAMAVRASLSDITAPWHPQLKWPNDVYLESRKVAGLLLETVPRHPSLLVVGVGVNVNNSIVDAPREVQSVATSVCDVTGQKHELHRLLVSILQQIPHHWSRFAREELNLQEDWRPHCLLTGRVVQLVAGAQRVRGRCESVDQRGALCLRTTEGLQRFFAGTIEQFD